jgi:hypothetical protein
MHYVQSSETYSLKTRVQVDVHRACYDRSSSHRAPRTGNEDPAPHCLDERHRLVHCLAPAFYAPALFATNLTFLQVGELPQMVYRVQIANLNEPSTDAFHDLPPSFETTAPVCLPFQQVTRV